jgi:hypothetical protein
VAVIIELDARQEQIAPGPGAMLRRCGVNESSMSGVAAISITSSSAVWMVNRSLLVIIERVPPGDHALPNGTKRGFCMHDRNSLSYRRA